MKSYSLKNKKNKRVYYILRTGTLQYSFMVYLYHSNSIIKPERELTFIRIQIHIRFNGVQSQCFSHIFHVIRPTKNCMHTFIFTYLHFSLLPYTDIFDSSFTRHDTRYFQNELDVRVY